MRVGDVAPNGYAVDRATVRQKKTGRPVKFELTDQTRQAVDDFLKEAGKRPGEYLFTGRRGRDRAMTTRQYARLLADWVASIGLDPRMFDTHSLRRTKATLIYQRTGNLRARCAISASRLTTRSRLPNKLMSESPGQSGHALPIAISRLGPQQTHAMQQTASSHSITLSARASNVWGTVMPSA